MQGVTIHAKNINPKFTVLPIVIFVESGGGGPLFYVALVGADVTFERWGLD